MSEHRTVTCRRRSAAHQSDERGPREIAQRFRGVHVRSREEQEA